MVSSMVEGKLTRREHFHSLTRAFRRMQEDPELRCPLFVGSQPTQASPRFYVGVAGGGYSTPPDNTS